MTMNAYVEPQAEPQDKLQAGWLERHDPRFKQKLLAHIKNRLQPFADELDQDDRDKIADKLLFRHMIFRNRDIDLDSALFDYKGKIDSFCALFEDAGLDRKDYLAACRKQPQLFHQSTDTLAENVHEMVHLFRQDNVHNENWLKACLGQPSLFYQSPATLKQNVDKVVEMFEQDGLERKAYVAACLRQPQLFYQLPDTVGRHIRYIMTMADMGILASGSQNKNLEDNPNPEQRSIYSELFEKITKYPVSISLADENLILRMDYAMLSKNREKPNGFSLLLRDKQKILQLYREKTGEDFALDKVNPQLKNRLAVDGLWPQ